MWFIGPIWKNRRKEILGKFMKFQAGWISGNNLDAPFFFSKITSCWLITSNSKRLENGARWNVCFFLLIWSVRLLKDFFRMKVCLVSEVPTTGFHLLTKLSDITWLQLDSNPQPLKASLAKWLSVRLWTKWLWVRVQLQSLKLQISRLLRAKSSLTFRQL